MMCCLAGCGSEELPGVTRVDSQFTVIDNDGTERQILSSELIDEKTGKPTFPKVLVIDRQARKKGFIEVE